MNSIEKGTSKQELQQLIISEWLKQILNGGTTIGFDFDKMMIHGKIMRYADTILELRQGGMQRIIVYTGGPINFKALWRTACGYKVLDALDLGTRCSQHELAWVEQAPDDIGVTIRATDDRSDVAYMGYVPPQRRLSREHVSGASELLLAERRQLLAVKLFFYISVIPNNTLHKMKQS
ncbi:MAG: hypothetical protein ACOC38_12900 [Promethearchaeia archaeon]